MFPDLVSQIPTTTKEAQNAKKGIQGISAYPLVKYINGRLTTAGSQRIKDMDEGGINTQILSFSGVLNTIFMDAEAGTDLARQINERLKAAVDENPGRYYAFAELPFHAPDLAIKELHRCVKELGFVGAMFTGSVGGTGKFLDDPEFDSVLSAFEELDVPLFLHPGIPPPAVVDTYYTLPGDPVRTAMLSGPGWGWHNESAVHALRLAATGTLERHPKLKVVIGHQGELMPAFLHRFDAFFDQEIYGLKYSVGETLRKQVWLSMSGEFSIPACLAAIQTWGVDRILFGNDYPYIDAQCVPAFLKALGDVVAPSDMRKICQTNVEELFKLRK